MRPSTRAQAGASRARSVSLQEDRVRRAQATEGSYPPGWLQPPGPVGNLDDSPPSHEVRHAPFPLGKSADRIRICADQPMTISPTAVSSLVFKAFEAFPHSTVILDQDGRIAAANEAWYDFGRRNGATSTPNVGDSYLAACDRAAAAGEETAARAASEIRSCLLYTSDAADE